MRHGYFMFTDALKRVHTRALCGAFDVLYSDKEIRGICAGGEVRGICLGGDVAGPQECPACEEIAVVERRVFAEEVPDRETLMARHSVMLRARYMSYGKASPTQTQPLAVRLVKHEGGELLCMVLLRWTETPAAYYCDTNEAGVRTWRGGRSPDNDAEAAASGPNQ